ncbi:MAG TPA: ribosome biogenesis GTP-binding protein YihA/YsxC [Gammaproteobacteria bacterium]|nr:ribosome biogenesis GTP-binding protein YihA/YsxC [Gammaproteobacteria bacterium]
MKKQPNNIKSLLHKASFSLSVPSVQKLLEDNGKEVAFVGRSNAGKSSTLNCLTQSSVARTSKTPGRTQAINVFDLDETRRLVDLPGYGYAKVSKATQKSWPKMMNDYLAQRKSLVGLIIIMDIRHPFKETDHWLLNWCSQHKMPSLIILNKADKLGYGKCKQTLLSLQKEVDNYHSKAILFSAQKSTGIEEVFSVLQNWLIE